MKIRNKNSLIDYNSQIWHNNLVEYLKRKKGFIVVSHDREFLDKVVDHIISINNTNISIEQGNIPPFDVANENFMAIKLNDTKENIKGIVNYAKEFGINLEKE